MRVASAHAQKTTRHRGAFLRLPRALCALADLFQSRVKSVPPALLAAFRRRAARCGGSGGCGGGGGGGGGGSMQRPE